MSNIKFIRIHRRGGDSNLFDFCLFLGSLNIEMCRDNNKYSHSNIEAYYQVTLSDDGQFECQMIVNGEKLRASAYITVLGNNRIV